ncbi:TPA: hypothetical protein RU539_004972 [Escherichia coli]|nr:hypothetical protein [Escherichia coli]
MQTSTQTKKITKVHQETIIDEDGIQKLHSTRESFTIPAEPPYVKLYLADIGAIHGLSKSQSDVLFQLAMLIGWDGMVSVSKTRFEKTIKPRVKIEYQSFKNIVAKLVEKGIFLRSGRGELEANPFIFARGDWPSIYEKRKNVELIITYDESGRHFKSKLSNK